MGRLYLKRKELPGFLHHMRVERMFVSSVLGRLSSLAVCALGEFRRHDVLPPVRGIINLMDFTRSSIDS